MANTAPDGNRAAKTHSQNIRLRYEVGACSVMPYEKRVKNEYEIAIFDV